MRSQKSRAIKRNGIELLDIILMLFLLIFAVAIIIPFWNVAAISFSTQTEYLKTPLMLFPMRPTLDAYRQLLKGGRILSGYKNTLTILAFSLPLSLILTTSLAYGLSHEKFPGKRVILFLVLFTMQFSGGIIPLYLVLKELNLINTLASVILSSAVNTFYFVLVRNYIFSLPESLVESARLDGAGEWRILFRIILPLCKPILATVTLFYAVDRWNEWYNPMIFLHTEKLYPLQLILRSIITESQVLAEAESRGLSISDPNFSTGIRMAAVIVTMAPIMCVFPFLQKYFVKGMMVGAIKS